MLCAMGTIVAQRLWCKSDWNGRSKWNNVAAHSPGIWGLALNVMEKRSAPRNWGTKGRQRPPQVVPHRPRCLQTHAHPLLRTLCACHATPRHTLCTPPHASLHVFLASLPPDPHLTHLQNVRAAPFTHFHMRIFPLHTLSTRQCQTPSHTFDAPNPWSQWHPESVPR